MLYLFRTFLILRGHSFSYLSTRVSGEICRIAPLLPFSFPPLSTRHIILSTVVISFSWWLRRVSVSCLAATSHQSTRVSSPLQPQTLTSDPLVGLISPPTPRPPRREEACGFMGGGCSLWWTIQFYHHREAVLREAEGCFWTGRLMEITDQSSDWQATDCTGLSGSWSMRADGFSLRWRIITPQDACSLTA